MKKLLFLFVLFFSFSLLIIHTNYTTSQNTCIYSNIAEPIFNISFDSPLLLDNTTTSVKYSFKISNYRDNTISDIPFYYYIYIENLSSDFFVQCYMDNEEINLSTFISEKFSLPNLIKEEHLFNIMVRYIGNFNNKIQTNLKLKIRYEQINNFY